jgi:glycine/D-amino acid oxidase-like deaminating enzyme
VVALPIWISYMEKILKEMPETTRAVPDGVVTAPTAVLAPGAESPAVPHPVESKVIPEYFYQESVPPPEVLRPFDLPAPPPAALPPAAVTPAPFTPAPVTPAPPPSAPPA